jgi:hypothetical protein
MWFVELDRLAVAGPSSLSFCDGLTQCYAIPDSGTSFLALPQPFFTSIVQLISRVRPDCKVDAEQNVLCVEGSRGLPNISFTFGGAQFVLTGEDYMLHNGQLAIQPVNLPTGRAGAAAAC